MVLVVEDFIQKQLDSVQRRWSAEIVIIGIYHEWKLMSNGRENVCDQSKRTFFRCHIHAFEYFGGVPKTVVPDNLKAAASMVENLASYPSRVKSLW